MTETIARRPEADALADLLHRAGDGDAAAFEEIYRRASPRMFATCTRVLSSRVEAEEALQEAFLAIWRRAATFDSTRGQAMGWLVAIARNQAIDRLRRAPRDLRSVDVVATISDARPSALDAMTGEEDERRLAACVDALDQEAARLLKAAYYGGMTYADVARRAEMPLGTVKTRIRRALLALRDCLR